MNDCADILASLDLPPEALAPFLAHIEQFCQAHGGERRYAELLALVERCRAAAA